MQHQRLQRLLTVIALAVAGLGAGPSLGHTATTTTTRANYDYDHSARFVQGASRRSHLQAGPSGVRAAQPHGDLALRRLARWVGVAAKSAETELAGYGSFRAAKADLGSPGTGNVFDHVVEQSQIGRSGFAAEEIHHPFNLNPVSARANQIKANYYSSKQPFTGGLTVRDWLNGQSFRDQYEFGMDVLSQIRAGTIK